MDYKKLLGISMAVVTIGGYVFNFNNFNSKDGLIRTGVDRLREMAEGFRTDLETLQNEYNALMNDLNSTQDALEQARIKLQQIYQKITGNTWDEANGDILEFDFESLLKDSDQYDNNVDGDAIGAVLGLPSGCTTEDIINAINDLIATVQSLEARITVLEGQVADLEAEIQEYETEQDSLVEEINGLKAKLDAATAEANAIIDGASQEEQEQLDYINQTLTELGGEAVEDNGTPVEPSEPELSPQEIAYNSLSDTVKTLVNAGYKPEYLGSDVFKVNGHEGYKVENNSFKNSLADTDVLHTSTGVTIVVMTQEEKAALDNYYNEFMAQ